MWQYNYNNELMHYGVKGMKWGVRRYQDNSGRLTKAGKERYKNYGGQKVTERKASWGHMKTMSYTNKQDTAEKRRLDKMASDYDYDTAMYEFDNVIFKYDQDYRENGEAYANQQLHKQLKNYTYEMIRSHETDLLDDGEEYVSYFLKVVGNKSVYTVGGDGDYADDQWFDKKD